jgi:predicted transcriptional regulator
MNTGVFMRQATTVRLTSETLDCINFLAEATSRSKSYILQEAVEQYVQREKSVIDDIRQGIDAMNEGRTLSHKLVQERLRAKGFSA